MTQFSIWKNCKYHNLFTATAYSIIFTITLTIFFVLANIIFPYPNILNSPNNVNLKLKYFAEHKDEYNAIFIGPSTTEHGIVPNLFDKLMAEQNREIKSFNGAIGGATVAEIDFYLRDIIALKPANLNWLFIEYPDAMDEKLRNSGSARSIYWHTPKQTILALRIMLEKKHPLRLKFIIAYGNLKSFLYRILSMGRFSNFWQQKVLHSNPLKIAKQQLLIEESGYISLDRLAKYTSKWDNVRRKLLNNLDDYYQNVDKEIYKFKQRNTASINLFKPYTLKVIKNMCDLIEEQGIKPIVFISPTVGYEETTAMELYKSRNTSVVFALNNPEAFPTLYQVDNRWDFVHLNDRGAREFTRSMAEQFTKYLETEKSGIYPL
ncbi:MULTISPECIES: hypothetical protein [Moorena]|uniref:DUF1574 domain-containing protein n=1 Tax=Moorena producens 3L TaxID=489825 RepID=F4XVU1_9CYAN|nr:MULTISPECIES: hypothetical protein [Moorena]EGJ31354.1 hypothetical protein LYNGBM3L_41020 [Moorena producens 3L]NEP34509.1 hypothetical protein [Moorena sp. SIO3B2]NEP70094.1 hypothetical protein [Moorena sp. SIO3A5]NER87989.1 hypothetical protein [Moorena sp. SIO3A2]OLT66985.1 hypothetical protein BI334_19995 [Moorena producens 3L]